MRLTNLTIKIVSVFFYINVYQGKLFIMYLESAWSELTCLHLYIATTE